MSNIEFYLEAIRNELDKLKEGKFTGNTQFQVNFKEGMICNMNCGLNRSIKQIEIK
jgi:hypothetical protein